MDMEDKIVITKFELFQLVKEYQFLINDDTIQECINLMKRKNASKNIEPAVYAREKLGVELRKILLEMRSIWFKVRNAKMDRELFFKNLKQQTILIDHTPDSPIPTPLPPPPPPPPQVTATFQASSNSDDVIIIDDERMNEVSAILSKSSSAPAPVPVISAAARNHQSSNSSSTSSNRIVDKDELNAHLTRQLELASRELIQLKEKLFLAEKLVEKNIDPKDDRFLLEEAKRAEFQMLSTANSFTVDQMFSLNNQDFGSRKTIRSILHKNFQQTENPTTRTISSMMIFPTTTTSSTSIQFNNNNQQQAFQMFTSATTTSANSILSSGDQRQIQYQQPSAAVGSIQSQADAEKIASTRMIYALAEKELKRPRATLVFDRSFRNKRKSYSLVTSRQKNRLKSLIKQVFSQTSGFLNNMGLYLDEVVLKDENEAAKAKKQREQEAMEIEDESEDQQQKTDGNDEEFKLTINTKDDPAETRRKASVYNLLYYKDKHTISDRAYNDLRMKCFLEIPSIFFLKKRRAEIDKMYEIYNNQMGVFISLELKLRNRLENYFMKKYSTITEFDDEKFEDDIIHVKLGADGTNIGRSLKLLNFTFTLMNEGARAKQASGNYTLGIYEIECENYAALTECFKELIGEIRQLKELKFGNKTLKIVYYLAADWKMLSIVLGIMGANSKYPCVWCKCPKEEFADYDKDWSIVDPELGARSHEEMAAILKHPNSKKIIKYGHEKEPVFKDIIPISRYIIDMLHLFLRISDTLFNLLIKDCSLADNFDMNAISKFEVSQYKHMNSLQHFLNEKCNVRFTFLWVAETKKLTWRDLVGKEKVRMFENFNLAEIIPDHPKFEAVSKIWTEFYALLNEVKQCKIEPFDLRCRSSKWIQLYLTVYNKTTITPYMHAFTSHLHEFIHLYKDVNAFNCQGLEKLNDISTSQYFKSTNKRDTALHQMLKKRNRLEYLNTFVFDDEDL